MNDCSPAEIPQSTLEALNDIHRKFRKKPKRLSIKEFPESSSGSKKESDQMNEVNSMFIKRGSSFMPTTEADTDIHKTLPVGNYLIQSTPQGQLYFEATTHFPAPTKVYGDTMQIAERILNTFMSRTGSTGVLLTGEKGSGKTLLAKILSILAAEKLGIPTVTINGAWCGDNFNKLIQDLGTSVILFDEFEKVYDAEEQASVLTLLDGVFPSKKLFVITSNDKFKLDRHMHNRPGRIFYSKDYEGLSQDFIEEYCNDVLVDKSKIDDIKKAASMFDAFNFDMLKALVEEMNRYKETPYQALKLLNIRPSSDEGLYEFTLVHKGQVIEQSSQSSERLRGNPLSKDTITTGFNYVNPDNKEDQWENVQFTRDDMISSDLEKGVYVFDNKRGTVGTLSRRNISKADFYKFMDY